MIGQFQTDMGIIRFILAVSVVVAHANSSAIFGLKLVPSAIAVQAFYIISGFYMSLILNEKYVHQPNWYRLFITNRFLRLFPTYWIVLVLTLLFSLLIFHHPNEARVENNCLKMYADHFSDMRLWSFLFLVFTNVFIFFQDAVMFMGLNTVSGHLFFTPDYRTATPEFVQLSLCSAGLDYWGRTPFLSDRPPGGKKEPKNRRGFHPPFPLAASHASEDRFAR